METDDSDDDVDNNDSEDNSHGVSEENEPPRLRKYFYKKININGLKNHLLPDGRELKILSEFISPQ